MAANGIRRWCAIGTRRMPAIRADTNAAVARSTCHTASAHQWAACTSIPTATGQTIIRYGIEKKIG